MKRWELIKSDEWIEGTLECVILSKRSVKEMRAELGAWIKKYRDELLHGNQGSGCSNDNCKVCYPYGKRTIKNI